MDFSVFSYEEFKKHVKRFTKKYGNVATMQYLCNGEWEPMEHDKLIKEYTEFNKYLPDLPLRPMESREEFKKRLQTYRDEISDPTRFIEPLPETNTPRKDMVNSPAHYTRGKQECIDIIEDVIKDAPDPVTGSLHSHVLKYVLRLWLKDNSKQDAEKAVWYLKRLIEKLD